MPISQSITARLNYQHETIAELVKGLTEEQLKMHVNPGKWSAFENIVHLVAYQPTFFQRLHLVAGTDNPVFERYIADNDPLFHQYLAYTLKELLDDMAAQRFLIINYLSNLSESALRRHGVHPLYGRFTINQWADFFLLHEAHHLFTIFMLTANLKKQFQQ